MPAPLISPHELQDRLSGPVPPAVLDVRWELATGPEPDRYAAGHVPGAVFIDLERDLAARAGPGGRHPLPLAGVFQAAMRAAGVDGDRPVIVYDAASATAAARAWWLLRYFGHSDVAVLDGGLAAWQDDGGALESGSGASGRPSGDFTAQPGRMAVLDAAGAEALPGRGVLLDARAAERFRGEREPVDPVAGHIPGAFNRPTTENLGADGRFLSPSALRAEFAAAGVAAGSEVGVYCGSGVTAAHEVLALELAGFAAALYPGSWSEWITDPERPVVTGP